jgi:predicted nucleic acid-binding protein
MIFTSLLIGVCSLVLAVFVLRQSCKAMEKTLKNSEQTITQVTEALANTQYFLAKTEESIKNMRQHDNYLGMLNRKYKRLQNADFNVFADDTLILEDEEKEQKSISSPSTSNPIEYDKNIYKYGEPIKIKE